jgi:DNA-binding MarR family transcriptional regulator
VTSENNPGTAGEHAELAARIRLAIARIHRQLRQDNSEGLTLTQLSTLVRIEDKAPVRPGQLAALEGISPSTLTRLIASLEEAKLIVRMTDPTDGRVSHLQLSAEGRDLLTRVRSRRTAVLQDRLSGLSDADREQLVVSLPALEQLGGD